MSVSKAVTGNRSLRGSSCGRDGAAKGPGEAGSSAGGIALEIDEERREALHGKVGLAVGRQRYAPALRRAKDEASRLAHDHISTTVRSKILADIAVEGVDKLSR